MSVTENPSQAVEAVEDSKYGTGERRFVKLTEKAMELYEYRKGRFLKKLNNLKEEIYEHIHLITHSENDDLKNDAVKNLDQYVAKYRNICNEYSEFLKRQNSEESVMELTKHESDMNEVFERTKEFLHLDLERKSDRESKTPSKSVVKSAHRKLEEGQVKLKFVQKESDLMKEQAKLEAESIIKKAEINARLQTLKVEKEVAIAKAEIDSEQEGSVSDADSLENFTRQRTEHFVEEQATRFGLSVFPNVEPTYLHQPFLHTQSADMMNVVTYLTKQSFMPQRIEKFNEQSESYFSWKLTFKDVMQQIKATPSEELELLINYLGQTSKREISSVKVSNAGDPKRGLEKAWERLDTTYGSPEKVEQALKKKLLNVVKIPITYKSRSRLYELSDVLNEILSVKIMPKYAAVFSYMDTSSGVQPVVNKLPVGIRNKWRDKGLAYKHSKDVLFPPFSYFCKFIRDMAANMNDPGFEFEFTDNTESNMRRKNDGLRGVTTNKTSVDKLETDKNESSSLQCLIHNAPHKLQNCRNFIAMTMDCKKELLRKHGCCFKCLDGKHLSKFCKVTVKCTKCGSARHLSVMHIDRTGKDGGESNSTGKDGGENVDSKCTKICGLQFSGKSCAKIILVKLHHKSSLQKPIETYAILDEQSNHTLANSKVFDIFDPNSQYENYPLVTCSGKTITQGRKSSGFVVTSLDNSSTFDLPLVIECDKIPNNRLEIPTPEVAESFSHLKEISCFIPPLNHNAEICLLIGRDLLPAHHIQDQKIGQPNEPFAQKLSLGWVVIGESCMDKHHQQNDVNVEKTYVRHNHDNSNIRPTVFEPCEYNIYLGNEFDIFKRISNDNKVAMSVEDREFLLMMDQNMVKGDNGQWVAPLPFRKGRQRLPNNRSQALDRAKSLDRSLLRNPTKCEHFTSFMKGLFESDHAERAPELLPLKECWYLPLFGVYHPQKKDRIRGVFDSSAVFNSVSLNKVLMSGPDLMNNLQGVLMRFRREKIAIMADIEQMFYCFRVHHDHRRFLRFIWHEGNDVSKPLMDYHMKVHVFGNSPSPAVATYGLRKTAKEAEQHYGSDVREFVERNFYVDDALSSHASSEEAIDLLKRTQLALQEHGGLRLHKIVSNSENVLSAFDCEDLGKDIRNIELGTDDLPTQRSLGLLWDMKSDFFTYKVSIEDKPFTRRGVLSSINSLFDPLGFVSPVIIAGKAILRQAMTSGLDWDEPLPQKFRDKWEKWKASLSYLQELKVPRTICNITINHAVKRDLYIFTDASEVAISAVAYLHLTGSNNEETVGFMLGKAKLAPKHGHTIPRLELCAAVLSTEIYRTIHSESDIHFDSVKYFTDSRVVLGYICNETKRFFTYVANRIERIRSCSDPQDWNYVPSKLNPADEGSRSVSAKDMKDSMWLNGPSNLCDTVDDDLEFPLLEPDLEVRTLKTVFEEKLLHDDIPHLGSDRFEHVKTWMKLLRVIALLQNFVLSAKSVHETKHDPKSPEAFKAARDFIILTIQSEAFKKEIIALKRGTALPRDSHIRSLDPFLDDKGLLRVGGRLKRSSMQENHPLIIPKKCHVAYLLIRYFHQQVSHQGRLITEGAIRSGGYWIVGVRRMISACIEKCFTCRVLRGKQRCPKMGDLPAERLEPAPPFALIGVDVFGPWNIVTRKTRGGQAQQKRWAVIFTCLIVRAIHIEVIHEMSSSSFINALRRLTALRGEVKLIRFDCGTNFVGAAKELNANIISLDQSDMREFLTSKCITWKFNPPHASHFGGIWERAIGMSRRILESLLRDAKHLTDEIFQTLMAEVCQIINARPIAGIPMDPYSPMPLSPAMILNLKSHQSVENFKMDDFSRKDLFKSQWRCVQQLANSFWKRWKSEYLSQLQHRVKWQDDEPNLTKGDLVLLRDKTLHRSQWPIGIVQHVYPSDDSRVRKVDIRVGTDRKIFTRPSSELVLLISQGD